MCCGRICGHIICCLLFQRLSADTLGLFCRRAQEELARKAAEEEAAEEAARQAKEAARQAAETAEKAEAEEAARKAETPAQAEEQQPAMGITEGEAGAAPGAEADLEGSVHGSSIDVQVRVLGLFCCVMGSCYCALHRCALVELLEWEQARTC